MCIGIPMQLESAALESGMAVGPHGREPVDLRLVGPCEAGQWLLVFLGAARERLSPERAAEIVATLELLQAGLDGHSDPSAEPAFALPSAMSLAELAALAGRNP